MDQPETPKSTPVLPHSNLAKLSKREREVLAFIAQGLSTPEIADRLFRSKKTVDSHRASLARKLGARNRVQLTRFAIAAGLVPSHDGVGQASPMPVDGQFAGPSAAFSIGAFSNTGQHIAVDHALPLEEFLETVNACQVAFWEWNIATGQTRASTNLLSMLGYESSEFTKNNDSWWKAVHPEDRAWVNEQVSKHLKSDTECYELEYRMIRSNGKARWFRVRSVVRRDAEGKAVRVLGMSQDLEGQRRVFARSVPQKVKG